MKKFYSLFLVIIIAFPAATFAGSNKSNKTTVKTISPDSAECYAAQHATICGKVYGYYYNSKINSHPTFLDMGACYPHSTFTVLITDSALLRFNYDVQYLVDNDVCVSGVVTVYNDKPEMIIGDPMQVTLDDRRRDK
jgi:hypothetical protein